MTELDMVKLSAFFDELGNIERTAVMQKIAIDPLSVGNVARTGWGMLKSPISSAKTLGNIYNTGTNVVAKSLPNASGWQKLKGGVEALWNTPEGKAGLVGGAGLGVAGIGTGVGFGAGRLTAPQQRY